MRSLFLVFAIATLSSSKAQNFYDKIMEMNIAIADTSKDVMELERGAYAIDRVSRGVNNNWPAYYHISLCFVRITDLLILNKDTTRAKKKLEMAWQYIVKTITVDSIDPENWILNSYHRMNDLRLRKTDPKELKLFETQLESFKKLNAPNPRACLVHAYFYKCFYATNKAKRKKALDLLQEANKLFELQQPKEFYPKWGKKWMNELKNELSLKISTSKTK